MPEFGFSYIGERRLEIHYREAGGVLDDMPKDAAGVMLAYEIRDPPPESPELLLHSVFTRNAPYCFEFAEEERGRTLYVALRWQTRAGARGPWSEILRAVIP
ncbi:MAG: hypothetical protein LBG87_05175 [Spirochaetaceae bacterium]|nr:hypothetical protein [Spirochaetaceae bacterium]